MCRHICSCSVIPAMEVDKLEFSNHDIIMMIICMIMPWNFISILGIVSLVIAININIGAGAA